MQCRCLAALENDSRSPDSTAFPQGDRLGICVNQVDPDVMEKGIIATPNTVSTVYAAIVSVRRIKYFKGSVASKMKFHCSIGHETVLGTVSFFGSQDSESSNESIREFISRILHLALMIDARCSSIRLEKRIPLQRYPKRKRLCAD